MESYIFSIARFIKLPVRYSSTLTNQKVWVVTDGGIENTLQAMALGKRLAGSNQLSENLKLKTIVSSKSKKKDYLLTRNCTK